MNSAKYEPVRPRVPIGAPRRVSLDLPSGMKSATRSGSGAEDEGGGEEEEEDERPAAGELEVVVGGVGGAFGVVAFAATSVSPAPVQPKDKDPTDVNGVTGVAWGPPAACCPAASSGAPQPVVPPPPPPPTPMPNGATKHTWTTPPSAAVILYASVSDGIHLASSASSGRSSNPHTSLPSGLISVCASHAMKSAALSPMSERSEWICSCPCKRW